MIRVPKGTRVVLMRHAESEWNRERFEALVAKERPPVRLPDKRDAALSPFGRLQAYLAGCYLNIALGGNGTPAILDVLTYSNYRRAEETAMQIKLAMGNEPRHEFQTNHLDEAHKWQSNHYHSRESERRMREQAKSFVLDPANTRYLDIDSRIGSSVLSSLSDVFHYELGQLSPPALGDAQAQPPEEAIHLAAQRTARQFENTDMPRLVLWLVEQLALSSRERRKTPSWENYKDVKDRARMIAKRIRASLWKRNGEAPTALIVTHSKISIALRELFEELPDAEVERILNADGPPFPPHVGMTFYKEVEGLLAPDGEPYRLPPELEVHGRQLELSMQASNKKLREACRAAGVRYASPREAEADARPSAALTAREQRGPMLFLGATGMGKTMLSRTLPRFSRRGRG